MSFFRRAGALIARFFQSAADPAAEPGKILLYAKDAAGNPQLFARTEDGTIYQVTPSASFPDIIDTPSVSLEFGTALDGVFSQFNGNAVHFQQAPFVGAFGVVLWQDASGQFLLAEQSSAPGEFTKVRVLAGEINNYFKLGAVGSAPITGGGTVNDVAISAPFLDIVSPPGGGAIVTGFALAASRPDSFSGVQGITVQAINNGLAGGGGSIQLNNEDAGSAAANRIRTIGAANIVIPPFGGWTMTYTNAGGGRWIVTSINN